MLSLPRSSDGSAVHVHKSICDDPIEQWWGLEAQPYSDEVRQKIANEIDFLVEKLKTETNHGFVLIWRFAGEAEVRLDYAGHRNSYTAVKSLSLDIERGLEACTEYIIYEHAAGCLHHGNFT